MLLLSLGALLNIPSEPTHVHAAAPQSMTVPDSVIDGSKTPERIPDGEAYKLLLLSISLTPDKQNDEEAATRRMAFVRQTGVSLDEIPQVVKIADDFRNQYENLSAAYNKKATDDAAKGIVEDPTKFANDLDGLVAMTRLSLQGALSTDSILNFHSHVLNLKRHMRVAQ